MGKISELAYIISLVAASSGIVLAWYTLFSSKRKDDGKFFLTLYLLAICAGLAEPFLGDFLPIKKGSFILHAFTGYTFLLGPFLFLYCKNNGQSFTLRWRDCLHFVPFCAYLTLAFVATPEPESELIVYEMFLLHVISYCVLCVFHSDGQNHGGKRYWQLSFQDTFLRMLSRVSLVLFTCIAILSNASLLFSLPFGTILASGVQLTFAAYVFFILLLSHNARV